MVIHMLLFYTNKEKVKRKTHELFPLSNLINSDLRLTDLYKLLNYSYEYCVHKYAKVVDYNHIQNLKNYLSPAKYFPNSRSKHLSIFQYFINDSCFVFLKFLPKNENEFVLRYGYACNAEPRTYRSCKVRKSIVEEILDIVYKRDFCGSPRTLNMFDTSFWFKNNVDQRSECCSNEFTAFLQLGSSNMLNFNEFAIVYNQVELFHKSINSHKWCNCATPNASNYKRKRDLDFTSYLSLVSSIYLYLKTMIELQLFTSYLFKIMMKKCHKNLALQIYLRNILHFFFGNKRQHRVNNCTHIMHSSHNNLSINHKEKNIIKSSPRSCLKKRVDFIRIQYENAKETDKYKIYQESHIDTIYNNKDVCFPRILGLYKCSKGKEVIDGVNFITFETESDMLKFTLNVNNCLKKNNNYKNLKRVHTSRIIIPTKTHDITKIKGWRNKLFSTGINNISKCENFHISSASQYRNSLLNAKLDKMKKNISGDKFEQMKLNGLNIVSEGTENVLICPKSSSMKCQERHDILSLSLEDTSTKSVYRSINKSEDENIKKEVGQILFDIMEHVVRQQNHESLNITYNPNISSTASFHEVPLQKFKDTKVERELKRLINVTVADECLEGCHLKKSVPEVTLDDIYIWCTIHFRYSCPCSAYIFLLKENIILPKSDGRKSYWTQKEMANIISTNFKVSQLHIFNRFENSARTNGSIIDYCKRNRTLTFKKKRSYEIENFILSCSNSFIKTELPIYDITSLCTSDDFDAVIEPIEIKFNHLSKTDSSEESIQAIDCHSNVSTNTDISEQILEKIDHNSNESSGINISEKNLESIAINSNVSSKRDILEKTIETIDHNFNESSGIDISEEIFETIGIDSNVSSKRDILEKNAEKMYHNSTESSGIDISEEIVETIGNDSNVSSKRDILGKIVETINHNSNELSGIDISEEIVETIDIVSNESSGTNISEDIIETIDLDSNVSSDRDISENIIETINLDSNVSTDADISGGNVETIDLDDYEEPLSNKSANSDNHDSSWATSKKVRYNKNIMVNYPNAQSSFDNLKSSQVNLDLNINSLRILKQSASDKILKPANNTGPRRMNDASEQLESRVCKKKKKYKIGHANFNSVGSYRAICSKSFGHPDGCFPETEIIDLSSFDDSIITEDSSPNISEQFGLLCLTKGFGYLPVQDFSSQKITVQDPLINQIYRTFKDLKVANKWLNRFFKSRMFFEDLKVNLKWVLIKRGMLKHAKPFNKALLENNLKMVDKNGHLVDKMVKSRIITGSKRRGK